MTKLVYLSSSLSARDKLPGQKLHRVTVNVPACLVVRDVNFLHHNDEILLDCVEAVNFGRSLKREGIFGFAGLVVTF